MRHTTPAAAFAQAGDFCWEERPAGPVLRLAIPTQPSQRGWVHSEWTIDHVNSNNAKWSWDRNKEKPTLNPSLHAVGVWHGWVKNGQLVEA